MELRNLLREAPKPQLHLHLDGSLSFPFIQQSIKRSIEANRKQDLPKKEFFEEDWEPKSHDELRDWLMKLKKTRIANESSVQKNSNWKVFDFCNQFLQTRQDLVSMTQELVTRLFEEHRVNYIEIRFAPILHTLEGLTEKDAILSVLDGYRQGVDVLQKRDIKVTGGIILCALRSYPISKAFETVDLCSTVDGVLGFDIAGDEGAFPLELFADVLKYAIQKVVPVTVHAGEWINSKAIENVRLAADIGVNRIGHGLILGTCDEHVFDELRSKNITVEVCLTSNCGNPQKCRSFAEHPLPKMLSKGIRVAGLNVDNSLLSGSLDVGAPNPTEECVRGLIDCRISPLQLMEIIKNGYEAGFAKDKKLLVEKSMEIWRNIYLPRLEEILANYKYNKVM